MKQAARALGWATSILWIILLFFTITVVYSAFQIRPSFKTEPSVSILDDTLIVSLPFILYNGGFYDISKFNITTMIREDAGLTIARSSTLVPTIPKGANTSITHNMSLGIGQLATDDLSYLLFNDSELHVAAVLRLTYADAFPFEISLNSSMPWGAPLSNLTVGDISGSSFVPLSFENHSYFEMSGTVQLEIVNNGDHVVGEGTTAFYASPESRFERDIAVTLSGSPRNVAEVRLYFQTTFFNYGPVVIPVVWE